MYIRKTKDIYILQGFYAGMWEDLFECETRREAREDLACYNENERDIAHRIIKRRVKINNN